MPRLIFVRHAPTATTGRTLTGRLPGIPLSDVGRELARQAAERFAGTPVAALYTSPVQRCRETAALLAPVVGRRPQVDRAFEEVDYGAWSGRSLASLRRTKLWRQLFVAPSRVRFPEGESLAEAAARAVAGCERLAARHRARSRVVIVSHADIIKLVLSHYLGQPLDLFQRLSVEPASFSVVDLGRDGAPRVPVVGAGAAL